MNRSWLLAASLASTAAFTALHLGACGSDDLTFQGTTSSSSAGVASGGAGAEGGAGSGASASSAALAGGAGPGGAGQGGSGAGQGGAGQGGAGQGGAGQGGSGGVPVCEPVGGTCAQCLYDTCNEAFCDCAGEPECLDLLFCLEVCAPADVACRKECYTAHESGISAAALLGDCGAGSCQGDCPITLELDACEECLYSSCETQMNTCVANPECYEILACISQCAPIDVGCPGVCVGLHPFGAGDAGAVSQCVDTSCPACK